MFSSTTKPLIAGTLPRPVRRELPVGPVRLPAGVRAAARAAVLDRRDAKDKVMDSVVERLLKELTW